MAFARKLNDRIANEVVAAYPERFRAFATLPLSEPEAAADELERSVREHGFVGCMSYGPIAGRFLDHADFAPVLARAEVLGVPIYIHPNWPSPQATAVYYDGLGDPLVSKILGGPGYGWHQEIALHCLRLIVSGTFDRFPGLQIVVGHMGEGLPFWYWRVGEDLDRIAKDRLHKPVQRYFHDNLWITTSAFFPRRASGARTRDHGRGPDHVLGRLSHGERQGRGGLDPGGRPAPNDQGEDRPRERAETSQDRAGLRAGPESMPLDGASYEWTLPSSIVPGTADRRGALHRPRRRPPGWTRLWRNRTRAGATDDLSRYVRRARASPGRGSPPRHSGNCPGSRRSRATTDAGSPGIRCLCDDV